VANASVQPPPEPRAPEELVLRGRSGDREALTRLIEANQGRIAKFVLGETRDANAYEDLCQAIFVKMVIGLPRLRETARFESWLFQIARNVCRDHLRARLGWRRYFVAWHAAHESIPAPAEDVQSGKENSLERTLAQLSADDRLLLRLHVEENRNYRELARLSNSTVAAIKSRLYRARKGLRDSMLAGDSE
jgi:RNA polymerase sigma-70 factor (ECF subfamily)